jgi:transcriptional regulator with XRE-family HTH domain
MIIGDRLHALRKEKKLSQRDLAERSGLKSQYISRLEHGHCIPSVEILEKWALALEVPLYRLFYDGERTPDLPHFRRRKAAEKGLWGAFGKDARMLDEFRRLFSRMTDNDRQILFALARQLFNDHKTI